MGALNLPSNIVGTLVRRGPAGGRCRVGVGLDKHLDDPSVHGIPPPHINEQAVIETIDPAKDVDGFHPVNVAKFTLGDPSGFVPCTPLGCQRLLVEAGIETAGAHAVVLGRSMIVGKPMALLLMNKG